MRKKILFVLALLVMGCCVLSSCNAPEIEQTTDEIVTESQEVVDHVHSYGEWQVTNQPTCTETGMRSRCCECGDTETQEIDSLGHDEVIDKAVEARCYQIGLSEGSHCQRCNVVLQNQVEIPLLPHQAVYFDLGDEQVHQVHCGTCGGILSESEPHFNEDDDVFCDGCQFKMAEHIVEPSCYHVNRRYEDMENGKQHMIYCADCDAVLSYMSLHTDNNADLICDDCGAVLPCKHGDTQCIDNEDNETHRIVCLICDEVIKANAWHVGGEGTGDEETGMVRITCSECGHVDEFHPSGGGAGVDDEEEDM